MLKITFLSLAVSLVGCRSSSPAARGDQAESNAPANQENNTQAGDAGADDAAADDASDASNNICLPVLCDDAAAPGAYGLAPVSNPACIPGVFDCEQGTCTDGTCQ
jgi:hypothetical protein